MSSALQADSPAHSPGTDPAQTPADADTDADPRIHVYSTTVVVATSAAEEMPSQVDPAPFAHVPPPDARTDFIEQIFQRVEEESARRAEQEEERSRPGSASCPPPLVNSSAIPATPVAVSAVKDSAARDRRRGSISVSRFGQGMDLSASPLDNTNKLPSRKNSMIINASSTGAFYQAQKYAGSADSFASDTDATGTPDVHDEEQVTQMETIAGRVSLGKVMGRTIARRLSRARTRSRDILAVPGPNGLVIGVSVEEATVEAEHHDEEDEDAQFGGTPLPKTPLGATFAYAQAEATSSPRSRRSTISMPIVPPLSAPPMVTTTSMQEKRMSAANWVAKAKDLTKKFKRKSMAVLPPNSSP